ncbi:YggS family pyridoxal phosphate-dependent enzyme [uncultured Megasphaera sp.]|uniref:YggS family pyridoxal phosphate-dependent enzyme n=1 Tax=uncultured Megasphaera sp. TaxID=165188 RepID=UPI0026595746|nr:YggS family pyridoxal phosphate-dependent enzyme [uncultured Megasphaera sp.]
MIKENIAAVKQRIAAAAARVGRTDAITLVAVTKNHPVEYMKEAAADGITDVGENRVQEALEKLKEFPDNHLTWHLIGHLQTNKAKQAVAHFDLIHSIDSRHLLEAVGKEAAKIGKVQDILLQVNVAREESKFGMEVEDFPAMCELAAGIDSVRVVGLMCMAPNYENVEDVRPVFRIAHGLYEDMKTKFPDGQIRHLSMGMTHDFEIAVEEGANMVRVGTAIFGARNY